MNTSLTISKSGMNGLQTNLDVISNNVANSTTVGYKQRNTNFHELIREDTNSRGNMIMNGIPVGMKAEPGQLKLTQGGLIPSSFEYDVALVGDGFFGVRLPNNQLALTRDGSFRMDAEGTLRTSTGNRVDMTYHVPANQWPNGQATIKDNGQVLVGNQLVGEIAVYDSSQFEQFEEVGENLYQLPNGATPQRMANPVIKQHYLEASNVDLAESMTDMIVTQRAYSMNAKVIQSTDDMMQIINNFKQ